MPLICQYCGEQAFDAEEQVCKSCGIVKDDIQFGSEYDAASSFKPYQSPSSKKNQADALNHGINALEHLCHSLGIAADVNMETLTLLKSVYSSKRKAGKYFRLREDVSILAACCLIRVQKKRKQRITVNTICSVLKCDHKKVYKMSKVLNRFFAEHPTLDDGNFIDNHDDNESISEKQVDDGDILESLDSYVSDIMVNVPIDIKQELIQKTTSLTKLAYSCWLLTGRSKLGVVTAAAYLCWKSMHPYDKTPLAQFCDQFSLNKTKARLRVPELKDMLLKLGRNIPSKTKDYVTEKNILFHLRYILENSESLRNDLLSNEFTEDAMNQKEFNTFRSCYLKKKPVVESVSSYSENMNASDIEISDTEIASYIRTDQQVCLIEKIRNLKNNEGNLSDMQ